LINLKGRKKERKKEIDKILDISKFYISACSNPVQYVRLHQALLSILLYYYFQLIQRISEVEHIEARVNRSN
jgi:hypothetical protein